VGVGGDVVVWMGGDIGVGLGGDIGVGMGAWRQWDGDGLRRGGGGGC